MKTRQQRYMLSALSGLAIILLIFLGVTSNTQEASESDSNLSDLEQKQLTVSDTVRRLGGTIQTVDETPVENLFLVETTASDLIYVTGTGKHFLLGTLFELLDDSEIPVNLTEKSRKKLRWTLLQGLQTDESINFAPEDEDIAELAVVYVFTDISCGYCRLLHRYMQDYNDAGIEIRYLAFPRAGIDSPAYDQLVSAWCADDPNAALTLLKNDKKIEQKDCENPVAEHLRLGQRMRVSGTPALVLSDGSIVPGFQKPDDLVQRLEQLENSDS